MVLACVVLFTNICTLSVLFFFLSHRTTEGLDMKLRGKYLVTVTATDTGGLSTNTDLEVRKLNGMLQPDWPSANTHVSLLCRFSRLMNHIKWSLNLHLRNKKLKENSMKSSSSSPQTFEDLVNI